MVKLRFHLPPAPGFNVTEASKDFLKENKKKMAEVISEKQYQRLLQLVNQSKVSLEAYGFGLDTSHQVKRFGLSEEAVKNLKDLDSEMEAKFKRFHKKYYEEMRAILSYRDDRIKQEMTASQKAQFAKEYGDPFPYLLELYFVRRGWNAKLADKKMREKMKAIKEAREQ